MRPDGSYRWGLLSLTALYGEPTDPSVAVGPIQYAVLHIVDTHELRMTKEALARREAELSHAQKVDGIGRLAAGIAHDFNNLLTVIVGHGNMLRDSLFPEGASAPVLPGVIEDVDAILEASERAASLTAQVLAHGRREGVNPRRFRLSLAVDGLGRLLARTIGTQIEMESSLEAAGSILADQSQVGQVVMNLVLNARDAMPEGGRLSLATADVSVPDAAPEGSLPGPGEWVSLIVSDSGHGMTPEVQSRMFEPFFTTREDRHGTQGTGLGLATVRRIVGELGGQIAVTSAPGSGTSVSVYFPRVDASAEPVAEAPVRAAPVGVSGARVLVVEDEPAVRALIASVLLGAGYRVAAARSVEEAMLLFSGVREGFQLVVSDLIMPGGGGRRLARVLFDRPNPPRMLFISGYANVVPSELVPYGTLLAKPFTPAQLLAAVEQSLA